MALINQIDLSQIEDEMRLDPQYYTSENMLLDEEINVFDSIHLGTIASITDGQHGYFKLDKNSDIRQITAKCIKEGLVDKTNADRLSIETHNKNLRSSLAVNDVLVTTAGTIGQVGLVTEDVLPANIDQDIGRVTIHDSRISPYFVWAFLQSKFGKFQIDRFTTGQVQTHLSLRKMKKVRIPLISNQSEIEKIVKRIVELRILSKKLYLQSQQLLEKELGLDKLEFQKQLGYEANYSDIAFSNRLDAQHYRTKYDTLFEKIKKHNWSYVRDINIYNRRGVQPIYAEDGEIDVINSQHIGKQHLDYDNFQKTTSKQFRNSPEAHIKTNDLLIYTTGAYIGNTNVYLERKSALASNHVNILRLKEDIDAAYLAIMMQSKIGKFQTEKYSRGSAQAELYPNDIEKFIVPILSTDKQKVIGDLARESLALKNQSHQLLEKAKAQVEELIEKAAEQSPA